MRCLQKKSHHKFYVVCEIQKVTHGQYTKWKKFTSVLAKNFVSKKCAMMTSNETFVERLIDNEQCSLKDLKKCKFAQTSLEKCRFAQNICISLVISAKILSKCLQNLPKCCEKVSRITDNLAQISAERANFAGQNV